MKKSMLALAVFGAFCATSLPAQTTTPETREGKIQTRKERQQNRIANGVKSGELTAGETANLEKKESNLNKEIRDERKENGGKLSAADKRQFNRKQNRISRKINSDKQNQAEQK